LAPSHRRRDSVRAGDIGDAMYVVLSGRLRVSIEHGNGMEEAIRENRPRLKVLVNWRFSPATRARPRCGANP